MCEALEALNRSEITWKKHPWHNLYSPEELGVKRVKPGINCRIIRTEILCRISYQKFGQKKLCCFKYCSLF